MDILKLTRKAYNHRYGFSLGIYLGAAVLTGAACYVFMKAFEFVYDRQLDFARLGYWSFLTMPLLFLVAVELIARFAPCADGAGIPQTIYAAQRFSDDNFEKLHPLVSMRTMAVKIAALLVGLWAGASTGREGPTVHVAACLFFGITWALHRLCRLPFNARSAVIAGGAAGLAAAFNTPLAGVTFAIEELSADYFSNIKDMVLMAIIVAGLAAKSLSGDYVYFGRLNTPETVPVALILLIGLLAGGAGVIFSMMLVEGRRFTRGFKGWARFAMIAVCAWVILALVVLTRQGGLMGPGNGVAQRYVLGRIENSPVLFALSKTAATLFTYWSGIAGGIFAPSLSIGSAIGAFAAPFQHASIAACAMLGMAAFLSGTIQAPITSFVIIFEMTDQHPMILPIMLASLLGYMVARIFKARHLYQALAADYTKLLA